MTDQTVDVTPQERLEAANKAYYEGTPIMTDAEYDALEKEVVGTEPDQVAGGYIPKSRKVEHVQPMLSLAKVHSREALFDWLRKTVKEAGHHVDLHVEPKWDGLSAEVVTHDGVFQSASTRGSGIVGEDITDTANQIPSLHDDIAYQLEFGRIPAKGAGLLHYEIVMDRSTLVTINEQYGLDFKNTRNAAAGIIRREDHLGMELSALLRVECYEHSKVATRPVRSDEPDGITAILSHIESGRMEDYDCDIDGIVVKLTNKSVQSRLGVTSHSPRWAVAYKFAAEEAVTTLREVVWTQGRTGKITPVAEFDPVLLAGATIRNATLHNEDFVSDLDLHIGDRITVRRAGDVIPYVSAAERGPDSEDHPITKPDVIEDSNVIPDAVRYALACLGTDGVGPGVIRDLKEYGLLDITGIVPALRSLLNLKEGDIQNLPGYGTTSEAKILWTIQDTRRCYLHSWVSALGIPGIGRTVSRVLCEQAGTLDTLIEMPRDEIASLDGMGPSRIELVLEAQQGLYRELQQMLADFDLTPPEYDDAPQQEVIEDDRWTGKNVVITGTIDGYTRSEMADALTQRGATVQGSVNSKTDVLVHGEKAGSKLAKAQSLGIDIIDANAVTVF